jgi:hypothetical protein
MEKEMTNRSIQPAIRTVLVRSLFAAILALVCTVGMTNYAVAESVTPPPTPIDITPPAGNTAFAVGHAFGSQGYVCLPDPKTGATSWTINAPRPEATLFVNVFGLTVQEITHFASVNTNPIDPTLPVPLGGNATWQSSLDSSKVWAAAVGHIDAGTDASCPNNGSIQCLLLKSLGNQQGPTGGSFLFKTTFVQRLNTKGGLAPTTACTVGQTQLQPYTADYYFFRADR